MSGNNLPNSMLAQSFRYDVFDVMLSFQFLVNNIKVIKANIKCTNGMINLISAPLTNPSMRSQNQKSAPPIVAIVIPVVCVVVVAAIVIISVVIYRKTQFGYWQLFHKWAPKPDSVSIE